MGFCSIIWALVEIRAFAAKDSGFRVEEFGLSWEGFSVFVWGRFLGFREDSGFRRRDSGFAELRAFL